MNPLGKICNILYVNLPLPRLLRMLCATGMLMLMHASLFTYKDSYFVLLRFIRYHLVHKSDNSLQAFGMNSDVVMF